MDEAHSWPQVMFHLHRRQISSSPLCAESTQPANYPHETSAGKLVKKTSICTVPSHVDSWTLWKEDWGPCIKKSSSRTTGFDSRRLAVVRSCRKTNSSQYAGKGSIKNQARHFRYFSEPAVTMLNMLSLLSTILHVPHPWTSRQAFAVRMEDTAHKKGDKSIQISYDSLFPERSWEGRIKKCWTYGARLKLWCTNPQRLNCSSLSLPPSPHLQKNDLWAELASANGSSTNFATALLNSRAPNARPVGLGTTSTKCGSLSSPTWPPNCNKKAAPW